MSKKNNPSLFKKEFVTEALRQSFVKLNPAAMIKNPVMFTVEIGTVIMFIVVLMIGFTGDKTQGSLGYRRGLTPFSGTIRKFGKTRSLWNW